MGFHEGFLVSLRIGTLRSFLGRALEDVPLFRGVYSEYSFLRVFLGLHGYTFFHGQRRLRSGSTDLACYVIFVRGGSGAGY